jgi:hypothetical protein
MTADWHICYIAEPSDNMRQRPCNTPTLKPTLDNTEALSAEVQSHVQLAADWKVMGGLQPEHTCCPEPQSDVTCNMLNAWVAGSQVSYSQAEGGLDYTKTCHGCFSRCANPCTQVNWQKY